MIEPTLNTVPGTELPGISFTKEELEKKLEEAFQNWDPREEEHRSLPLGVIPTTGMRRIQL